MVCKWHHATHPSTDRGHVGVGQALYTVLVPHPTALDGQLCDASIVVVGHVLTLRALPGQLVPIGQEAGQQCGAIGPTQTDHEDAQTACGLGLVRHVLYQDRLWGAGGGGAACRCRRRAVWKEVRRGKRSVSERRADRHARVDGRRVGSAACGETGCGRCVVRWLVLLVVAGV